MAVQRIYTAFTERFDDDRGDKCSFKHLPEYCRELGLANPDVTSHHLHLFHDGTDFAFHLSENDDV